MAMDESSSPDEQEQVHLPLISDVPVQQDIHIVYPATSGTYVPCGDRGASEAEAHHGYDLESGILVSEPEGSSFLASARRLVGNVGVRLSFTDSVNGSIGGHTGNIILQCGPGASCSCQQKVDKMGFSESTVEGFKKHGLQDLGLPKTRNTLSGSSEKIRHGKTNIALKPGWKKPPRPPRATAEPSKERKMKGISDTVLIRRARLERMKSLRRQKVGKPSSTKTTLWALLFTVFFFVIVITQGIYSQGTVNAQDSSTKLGQTSSRLMHKLANNASNNDSVQTLGLGGFSAL